MKERDMRLTIWISLVAAAALTLGAALSPVFAADPNPEAPLTARVLKVKGRMLVKDGEKDVELTQGATVREGQEVQASEGASGVLELSDGSRVIVFPATRLRLERPAKKTVRLDQKEGFTWIRAAKKQGDESFEVKTPVAVAGVRGTAFSADVDPEGHSAICVCEGKVEVESGGQKQMIRAGELVAARPDAMDKPFHDRSVLERPEGRRTSCLECHQGGFARYRGY